MRLSFYLISLAILISSVFVSAGPVPDGNGGNSCSACWVEQRNKIRQCQNIPKGEVDEFSGLSDQQIVDKKADFPHLIPCLCALVPKVPSIIDTCNCNADDAKGLTKESIIVKDLCTNVVDDSNQPTQKPNKTDTSNTNNTTNNTTNTSNTNNNNNKPGGGTGDDSTPGDGSGDGSGYDNSTVTNTTADGSKPVSTSAAISAQWAGSLIVTLGAVVIGLVAL